MSNWEDECSTVNSYHCRVAPTSAMPQPQWTVNNVNCQFSKLTARQRSNTESQGIQSQARMIITVKTSRAQRVIKCVKKIDISIWDIARGGARPLNPITANH